MLNNRTFENFQMRPDMRKQAIRTKISHGFLARKKRKRMTLNKVLTDGYRKNTAMVEQALTNLVVLNFRMADFQRDKDKSKIRLDADDIYPGLEKQVITRAGGPKIFVDLDNILVFAYLPRYIGARAQIILLNALSDLLRVCSPCPDKCTGDRRSTVAGVLLGSGSRSDYKPQEPIQEGEENQGENEDYELPSEGAQINLTESGYSSATSGEEWENVEPDPEGEIRRLAQSKEWEPLLRSLLQPSSYYLAGGWYQRGMENKRAIEVSKQLREILQERSRAEAIKFLQAKVEFDCWIVHLIAILHRSLHDELNLLRSRMRKDPGDVRDTVTNGWSSLFPCMAIGFNRTTKRHRDSNGFRHGLDVIGVLGCFSGGDFLIPHLGLRFEWGPGSLGVFDGYDLAHEVAEWDGPLRTTLISFCRSSSWRGLKLPMQVAPPTLDRLKDSLASAQSDKADAGEAIRRKVKSSKRSAGSSSEGGRTKRQGA